MNNPLHLEHLSLPAIAAPMFLVSGTALVLATCKAGVPGIFPAANARTSETLEIWLTEIVNNHDPKVDAPWGINLNTHRLNPRLQSDIELTQRFKAPLVVTALGAPSHIVEAIHGYGGKIAADVTTLYHAKKAVDSGVDALVLVCAGAGGHTGRLAYIPFINEVRQFWQGPLIVGGGLSSGQDIVSALCAGADYAYLGTRFIATEESMVKQAYRDMLIGSSADDILCTDAFTGIPNNMLKPSIALAGIDPDNIRASERSQLNFKDPHAGAKAWRDIWSAGQGVGSIKDTTPAAELVSRLRREFELSLKTLSNRLDSYIPNG